MSYHCQHSAAHAASNYSSTWTFIIWMPDLITKLRRSYRSRSTDWLILWLNRLLIDFFDPNLKPDFKLLPKNQLKCVQIISKRLKSVDFNRKEIEIDWKQSKKSKYIGFFDIFQLFRSFDRLFWSFNRLWLIF